jgi:hypothetical protein
VALTELGRQLPLASFKDPFAVEEESLFSKLNSFWQAVNKMKIDRDKILMGNTNLIDKLFYFNTIIFKGEGKLLANVLKFSKTQFIVQRNSHAS